MPAPTAAAGYGCSLKSIAQTHLQACLQDTLAAACGPANQHRGSGSYIVILSDTLAVYVTCGQYSALQSQSSKYHSWQFDLGCFTSHLAISHYLQKTRREISFYHVGTGWHGSGWAAPVAHLRHYPGQLRHLQRPHHCHRQDRALLPVPPSRSAQQLAVSGDVMQTVL